ncbi:hypothetical protein LINGRAHAP2_LOCUS22999, partial [Linum grandiflorum]
MKRCPHSSPPLSRHTNPSQPLKPHGLSILKARGLGKNTMVFNKRIRSNTLAKRGS